MIEITPTKTLSGDVAVPGSKSYTHRILIAAALSDGICEVANALNSEDTRLTQAGLKQLGIVIEGKDDILTVFGANGRLKPADMPIYLGNSGTSMRLLTAVASLGSGTYTLTGTDRMSERPIQDLLDALNILGIDARSQNNTGCPPVVITGGKIAGGRTRLRCGISSQFLSGLLLIAPYTENGLDIEVTEGPVSKPYIDMTVDIMTKMGIAVSREGYERFAVAGGQMYRHGRYIVEPDCSQAGYFWAAAAIAGGSVKVRGITRDTRQGDVRFVEILEQMGCRVVRESDGIIVTGGKLIGIEADMSDMPDIVPTLAVVAAFAHGTTAITNVAHLKAKESDRLAATANELKKMGIEAAVTGSGLIVPGGTPHGAVIDTHNDHRMAMSFALAGLKVPEIFIENETCVEKSFPDFWDVLGGLCGWKAGDE
jgi:3-phosphoshikimate 1-carboxyvinyltransferase